MAQVRQRRVLRQAHVVFEQVEILRVILEMRGEAFAVEKLRLEFADPRLANRRAPHGSRRVLRAIPQRLHRVFTQTVERFDLLRRRRARRAASRLERGAHRFQRRRLAG